VLNHAQAEAAKWRALVDRERQDKDRRIEELEFELDQARSDSAEWQAKLAKIKAALGLA
jgi:FtsZ-binding cell division protein ZapB